jgi:aminoglycoside phosphotransferase family enzyme
VSMSSVAVSQRLQTGRIVEFLSDPAAYPEATAAVDRIETHMAYVFLTDRFAYKLKKPVRYAFLDFSTGAARRLACDEEVRLNRRLAPDVYLGVAAVVRDASGALRIGAVTDPEPLDWLVRMRRLPRERMLDAVIRAGGPTDAELRAVMTLLAGFWARAPVECVPPAEYVARLERNVAGDVAALCTFGDHLPRATVRSIGAALQERLRRERHVFEARARERRVVEGHGDLRPEHICLVQPAVVIDCLEFRRDFRTLDPVDEVAFLGLECERLGAPALRAELFRMYTDGCGDRPPAGLIDFHTGARALLRARIAIWHLHDGDTGAAAHWHAASLAYLGLAARHAGIGTIVVPAQPAVYPGPEESP